MVLQMQEKVTVILPKELKSEVEELKKTLKISMNSIYQLAIAEYVDKKRRESLRKQASSMIQEYSQNQELAELQSFSEDINAY
jgi:DNA-binding transcriptional MocR family regulator